MWIWRASTQPEPCPENDHRLPTAGQAYADREGCQIVGEYLDDAISGVPALVGDGLLLAVGGGSWRLRTNSLHRVI